MYSYIIHIYYKQYTHKFMLNICVCLCTVCSLHVQYECMYACGWLCRYCMAYECLMCTHICMWMHAVCSEWCIMWVCAHTLGVGRRGSESQGLFPVIQPLTNLSLYTALGWPTAKMRQLRFDCHVLLILIGDLPFPGWRQKRKGLLGLG